MLKFSGIKKSFKGVEVLHGISFEIEKGSVTAIVGENGAGKSTLMKILSGVYAEYEGEIFIDNQKIFFKNPKEAKDLGISIIHQELSCFPDLTVAENIFIGNEPVNKIGLLDFSKLTRDSEKILEEFSFPYSSNIKVKNLSVGWQQVVEIAHALSKDAKIIIFDEPTSALTENEIKILFEKIRVLKQRGKAVIFISHRFEEIYDIADDIIVLRDGNFIGKYGTKEISRSELINKMVGKELIETNKIKHSPSDEVVFQVKDLTVFDKNKIYLSGISFELRKGEILGLAGLLGSGKSELLKFLYGEFKSSYTGKIFLGNGEFKPKSAVHSLKRNIFYLSKDRKAEGIFAGLDLINNSIISDLDDNSSLGILHKKKINRIVNDQFKMLNIKFNSLRQPIQTLSGGNQQKVLISRGMLTNPYIMLLDEPTRGIDVGAKEEIYNLMKELSRRGISFIVSTSEVPELLKICDRVLVLFNGELTAELKTKETDTKNILHYTLNQKEEYA